MFDVLLQAWDRFHEKTKRSRGRKGCLLWTGAVKKPSDRPRSRASGGPDLPYGIFWLQGKCRKAHRVALALHLACPEETLPLVGHSCDNSRCVNPLHLTLSTHTKNLQEAYERGRRRTG